VIHDVAETRSCTNDSPFVLDVTTHPIPKLAQKQTVKQMTSPDNVPFSEAIASSERNANAIPSDALPTGFSYAGVACGIKPSGNLDVSLIVSEQPVVAAGVYTQNQVVAAPVVLTREKTPNHSIRAVITNSGNANACTGDQGMADAQEMCSLVADKIGCSAESILLMSTGVIGKHLPMDCIRNGIRDAYSQLEGTPAAFVRSAEAIRTTDKNLKVEFEQIDLGGREFRIAAMAKGAGMIAPNMATMLSTILTDVPLTAEMAQETLSRVAAASFNRVSVDGHTSTNDTLLLLSSGQGTPLNSAEQIEFENSLTNLAIKLAKQLVADGEGARHVMSILVKGAADESTAEIVAKTVAASPLVKTAITGGDPNWGRIVSAAGYAEARICPEKTSLQILGTTIYLHGSPVDFDEAALSHKMKTSPEVSMVLSVGDGPGTAQYWASDLTTDYVQFNSEYTT